MPDIEENKMKLNLNLKRNIMRKKTLSQLTLLTAILLTSCSSIQKLSPSFTRDYRIIYSCPNNYLMAIDTSGTRFCVLGNDRFKEYPIKKNETNKVKKKTNKNKVNCQKIFREINKCMR